MSNITNPAVNETHARMEEIGKQAKIYAARMRLQNAADQADALDGIREIAGNLIGTEEVAVFKVDKERSGLWLYWSFGVDPNQHAVLEVNREPKLKDVLNGKCVFRLRLSNENLLSCDDRVTALIPVRLDDTTIAVIVLFRLFPHKSSLDAVDHEICEVLSNCAGRAIEPHR
jgi:GAF domain